MIEPTTPSAPTGPAGLATALLDTMQQELDVLAQLQDAFRDQLDALSARRLDRLETAAEHTSVTADRLGQLRTQRERQSRLLGRVLRLQGDPVALHQLADALAAHPGCEDVGRALAARREQLTQQARQAQERCGEIEFTLNYAAQLSHELVQAVQGLNTPHAGRVYTARGDAAASAQPSSLVNRLG